MIGRLVLVLGAAALLFSTFLNWFPGGIEGAYLNRSINAPAFSAVISVFGKQDAWQAFSVIDILLAALAAATALATLVGRSVASRVLQSSWPVSCSTKHSNHRLRFSDCSARA